MKLGTGNRRLPPGVRFHPTDVELVMYYLLRKVSGQPPEPGYVAEADIYQFHPADLGAFACFSKELNWYFFCATGKKYASGERKKRSTHCGFWKPTGNDRVVVYRGRTVGKVKTLVFYEGKPAKGERTDWFMYEYRLEDGGLGNKDTSAAIVLCRIFKKGGMGHRNGEQFGAVYNEEEWDNALEPIAERGQSSVSADVNTITTEQVHSTSDANPFQKKPTAATDVASTSMALVPDNIDEMFCPDDFGVPYVKLNDFPYMTLDDLDDPL